MLTPSLGAGADDEEEDLAQGPLDSLLKKLLESRTPTFPSSDHSDSGDTQRQVTHRGSFARRRLGRRIGCSYTEHAQRQDPLTATTKGKTPLPTKKTRVRFGQVSKEGKKLAKELGKLKSQPGWSESWLLDVPSYLFCRFTNPSKCHSVACSLDAFCGL